MPAAISTDRPARRILRWGHRLASAASRLDWSLIATVLAVKGLILAFGALSYQVLTDEPVAQRGWLDIWNRWDARSYLNLARDGYAATGRGRLNIVYYPLYPWLTRAFGWFAGGPIAGGMLVSGVASVAAALLLQRLVLLDDPPPTARRAAWFLLIFPTGFFLHIVYTESLFLALVLGCVLAAREERWRLAGLLGALASLTRSNGLMLIPVLAVEAWLQYRRTRRFEGRWLWTGAVALGFAGYLALNFHITGDPLRFQAILKEHWHKSLTWPWIGLSDKLGTMMGVTSGRAAAEGLEELVFAGLGLLATVAGGFTLRASYTLWMAGNWLMFTSTGFVLSVPRYTLLLFPIYILLARLAARPFWLAALTVWSLLLLGLFVARFVQGWWVA